MKKLFFILLIVIGILSGYLFTLYLYPSSAITKLPIFHIKLQPKAIRIPTLGIQASIESVGKEPDGKMGNPKNTDNVGWYSLGPTAGERATVVMDGHYDSHTGPAVFYKLAELSVGDEIAVTNVLGKEYRYEVYDIRSYPKDEFPIEEVFGNTGEARLNLITCEGVFSKQSKTYSHRTVVFAKLK
jgi:LPXTG-site transpeptidase (sortase) family protein